MDERAQIELLSHGARSWSMTLEGGLEVGRQRESERPPFDLSRLDETSQRLVIAGLEDVTISRRHLYLKVLPGRRVEVVNLSSKLSIGVFEGESIRPGQTRVLTMPTSLGLSEELTLAAIAPQAKLQATPPPLVPQPTHAQRRAATPPPVPGMDDYGQLDDITLPPMPSLRGGSSTNLNLKPPSVNAKDGGSSDQLVQWLQGLITVFQSAANSPDFLEQAAWLTRDLVDLDSVCVLLIENDRWKIKSKAGDADADPSWRPSMTMLETLRGGKRTLWKLPQTDDQMSLALAQVEALVASPILDPRGDVVGAVYGDRRGKPFDPRAEIGRPEATLVELMACCVAGGLARLEQEQAALEARVRFEQFFSPQLASELEDNPRLLEGKDTEISVLFCDIRGFSGFTERLGPERTLGWINEVLQALSQCVIDYQGVLVDYVGDELMAIWGAPVSRDDHAMQACKAALAMIDCLPALNERWEPTLGKPMNIGVGIGTGRARVGNVGSHIKFKYGALGNTVNLASRVQGASKQFGTRLLITGATARGVRDQLPVRRLGKVGLLGIVQPVDLYELSSDSGAQWQSLREGYEQALTAFEAADFRRATQLLGNLNHSHPGDRPALLLLSRAVQSLATPPDDFDGVWRLESK